MLANVRNQALLVGCIQVEGRNVLVIVGVGDFGGDAWLGVTQLDVIIAGFG